MKLATVTRDPIDRLLSGYIDICLVRRIGVPSQGCYQCGSDFGCFIMENYNQMKHLISNHEIWKRQFVSEHHFYPQNWLCQYNRFLRRYQFIKHNRSETFYRKLLDTLRSNMVTQSQLRTINHRLKHMSTDHATTNYTRIKKTLKIILQQNFTILETVLKTYYYDFQITVTILLDTLPMLGNVLLLCFFVFFVFSIVGLQLWKGVLRQRCVPGIIFDDNYTFFPDPGYYEPDFPEDSEWLCSKPTDNGDHTCQGLPPTLNDDGTPCTGSWYDSADTLIANGDCYNFNQYYNVCGTTEDNPFGGSISFDNILYSLLAVFVAISMDGWVDIMYTTMDAHSQWNWIYFVLLVVIGSFYMVNLFLAVIATQFGVTKKAETAKMAAERAAEKQQRLQQQKGKACGEMLALSGARIGTLALTVAVKDVPPPRYQPRDLPKIIDPNLPEFAEFSIEKFQNVLKGKMIEDDPSQEVTLELFDFAPPPPHVGPLGRCQDSLKKFVDGTFFSRSIMIAIILNTVSMAVEHYNQPDLLTEILEYTNYFFTALFAVEMGLKLLAYGPRGYARDPMNLFDGTIVIVSLIELFQGGGGSLSVLRTFRLLRVFKLVRFIPSLRYQLVIMIKCFKNVTVFFILLVLFIFIFTLLGMVLFGGKLCRKGDGDGWCSCDEQKDATIDCECERDNFDDLLHAAITVFMVLTGTYGDMLFTAMERLGAVAALYFVLLLTFGNYILLNLLVGILLEGFEDTDQDAVLEQLDEEMEPIIEPKVQNKFADLLAQGMVEPNIAKSDAKTLEDARTLINNIINAGLGKIKKEVSTVVCSHKTYPEYPVDAGPFSIPQKAMAVAIGAAMAENADTISTVSRDVKPSWNNRKIWQQFMENALIPPKSPDSFEHNHWPPAHSGGRSDVQRKALWDNKWLWERHMAEETGFPKPQPYCPYHGTSTVYPPPFYTIVDDNTEFCNCMEPIYEKTCLGSRRDYAFFLCSAKCFLRKICIWLVTQRWFDWVVLFFIALNCLTFAMERPAIEDGSPERLFLTYSNYVFTAIFTLEMFLKVIAKGFICGPDAYLKDGWNILDGTLVFVSWVSIIFDVYLEAIGSTDDPPPIFGVIRVLRLLRALRPLRVINRAPGLKIVVSTLVSSMKPIGSVMLICGMFFLIFAILGVQLYAGTMFYCDAEDLTGIKTKNDCLSNGFDWVNSAYNFDDLGHAVILLFVLSTLDNWNELLYQGMDIVGEDMQPQPNAGEWNVLYYVIFVMLVGFFILNMFVGVVVENFQQNSEEVDRQKNATREQNKIAKQRKRESKKVEKTRWQKFCIYCCGETEDEEYDERKVRVKSPFWTFYGPKRLALYNFVTHRYFDLAIAGIIGLNVLTMSIEFYDQPDELTFALKICNYIFTAVFTLEAAFKIAALGLKRYFGDGWNRFDMVVVVLSFVGIALEEMKTVAVPINPTIIRVMRVLRITRILKLMKMAKGIQSLMDCVAQALPQVGNLAVLFILMFYIFSALGVELFGKIECSSESPCEGMGEHVNFKNFPLAFLTLFRVATGDNWNSVMLDTMKPSCCNETISCTDNCCGEGQKSMPNCCDSSSSCDTNCCVTQGVGPLYFFLFVLLSAFVLMNLVVAVLLKYLEEQIEKPSDVSSPDAAVNLAARGIQQDMIERRNSTEPSKLSSLDVNSRPVS